RRARCGLEVSHRVHRLGGAGLARRRRLARRRGYPGLPQRPDLIHCRSSPPLISFKRPANSAYNFRACAARLASFLRLDPHPGTRAVLFTATSSDARIHDALDLGVSGVVLKEMPPEALVQCVRKVHAGEQWLAAGSRRFAGRRRQQRDPDRRRRRAGLTARETDIVKLVARGFANEEIARRLTIKEGTLKIHLHNIYRKLNVDSRLSLTLYVQ